MIAINSLLRLRDGGLTAFYFVDTLLTQAACSQLQMKDSCNQVTNGLPCLDDVMPLYQFSQGLEMGVGWLWGDVGGGSGGGSGGDLGGCSDDNGGDGLM